MIFACKMKGWKMNKIKVLLIDDNENLVDMVKQYFSSHDVIEVVDVAFNG